MLLPVPQHGCDDHDCQPDPEQHKEAAEVAVVARGVEVGDAIDVFDGGEHALPLLGPDMAARGRGGLHGRRRILWDGS